MATLTVTTLLDKTGDLFSSVCKSDIQDAIDTAESMMSVSAWGSLYDNGLFLLSCHFVVELQMLTQAGNIHASANAINASPLKMEKIGEWQAAYGGSSNVSPFDGDPLATTSWGRAYIARRDSIFAARC